MLWLMWIGKLFIITTITFILLFVVAACKVSGRESEAERRRFNSEE